MIKQVPIPKEQLLPEIKKTLVPELKKELKKHGVTGVRFVDIEWTLEGLIFYYEESAKPPAKPKRK